MSREPPHLSSMAPGESFLHPKSLHFMATSLDTLVAQQQYAIPPPPPPGTPVSAQPAGAKPNSVSDANPNAIPKPTIEKLPLYTTNVQLMSRVMETMLGFNPAAGPSTIAFAEEATALQTRQTALYTSSSYFNHHHAASSREKEFQLQLQQQAVADESHHSAVPMNEKPFFQPFPQPGLQGNYAHGHHPSNLQFHHGHHHGSASNQSLHPHHPPAFAQQHYNPPPIDPLLQGSHSRQQFPGTAQSPFYFSQSGYGQHDRHLAPHGSSHFAQMPVLSPSFQQPTEGHAAFSQARSGGPFSPHNHRPGVGLSANRTYPAQNHPYNGRYHHPQSYQQLPCPPHQPPPPPPPPGPPQSYLFDQFPSEPPGPVYLYNAPGSHSALPHPQQSNPHGLHHSRHDRSHNQHAHSDPHQHFHPHHLHQPPQSQPAPAPQPRLRFWDRLFSRQTPTSGSSTNSPDDRNNTRRSSQMHDTSIRNSGGHQPSGLRQVPSAPRHGLLDHAGPSHFHNSVHSASSGMSASFEPLRNPLVSFPPHAAAMESNPGTPSTGGTPVLYGRGWRSFFPSLGDYVELYTALSAVPENQHGQQQQPSEAPAISQAQQLALERFEMDQDYIQTLVKYGILPQLAFRNGRPTEQLSNFGAPSRTLSHPAALEHNSPLTTSSPLVSSPFLTSHASAIVLATYPSPMLDESQGPPSASVSPLLHRHLAPSTTPTAAIYSQFNPTKISSFHDLYYVQQRMLQTVYSNSAFVRYHEWKQSQDGLGVLSEPKAHGQHDPALSQHPPERVNSLTLDVGPTMSQPIMPQPFSTPTAMSYSIFGGFHLSSMAGSLITPRQPVTNHNLFFNPSTPVHQYDSIFTNLAPRPQPASNVAGAQTPRDYQFTSLFGRPFGPASGTDATASTAPPTSVAQASNYSTLYGTGTLSLDHINVNTVPTHTDRLRCTLTAIRQKENHNLVMLEPYFSRLFAGKPSCIDRSDGVASITPRKLAPLMTQSQTTYRERIIGMKQAKLKLYQLLLPWSILVQDGLNVLSLQHELNKLQLAKATRSPDAARSRSRNNSFNLSASKPTLDPEPLTDQNQLTGNGQAGTIESKSKPSRLTREWNKFKATISAQPRFEVIFHPPAVLKWVLLPTNIRAHEGLSALRSKPNSFSTIYTQGITLSNPNYIAHISSPLVPPAYPKIPLPQTPRRQTPYLNRFGLPPWLLKTSRGHRKEATAWKYLFVTPEPLEHFAQSTDSSDVAMTMSDFFSSPSNAKNNSNDAQASTGVVAVSDTNAQASRSDQAEIYNRYRDYYFATSVGTTDDSVDFADGSDSDNDFGCDEFGFYAASLDGSNVNSLSGIDSMTDCAMSDSTFSAKLQALGQNLSNLVDPATCFLPAQSSPIGRSAPPPTKSSGSHGSQGSRSSFGDQLGPIRTSTAMSPPPNGRHSNTELHPNRLASPHRFSSTSFEIKPPNKGESHRSTAITAMDDDEKDDARLVISTAQPLQVLSTESASTASAPPIQASVRRSSILTLADNEALVNDDFDISCVTLPTQEQIDALYHRENALGCSHYERACHIAATCCSRFYCCRYCHDAAERHAIVRKNIEQIVCVYCLLDLMEAESQVSMSLFQLYEPAKHILLTSSMDQTATSATLQHCLLQQASDGKRLATLNEVTPTRLTSSTQFAGSIHPQQGHYNAFPGHHTAQPHAFLSPQPIELQDGNLSYPNHPSLRSPQPLSHFGAFASPERQNAVSQMVGILSSIPVLTSLPPTIASISATGQNPSQRPGSGAGQSGDSVRGKSAASTDPFAKDEAGGFAPFGRLLSGDDLSQASTSMVNDQDQMVKKLMAQLVPKAAEVDNYELSIVRCILLKVEALVSQSHFMHTQYDFHAGQSQFPLRPRPPQYLASSASCDPAANSATPSLEASVPNGQLANMSKPLHRVVARQTCITDLIAPDKVVPNFDTSVDAPGTWNSNGSLILNTVNNSITHVDPVAQLDPDLTTIDPFHMANSSTRSPTQSLISASHFDITHSKVDEQLATKYTQGPMSPYYNSTAPLSSFQEPLSTPSAQHPSTEPSQRGSHSAAITPVASHPAADTLRTNSGPVITTAGGDESASLNEAQRLQFEQTRLEQERLAVFYQSVSALQDRFTAGMELLKAGIEYLHQLPGASQKNDMVLQLQRFLTIAKHPDPSSISTILATSSEHAHRDNEMTDNPKDNPLPNICHNLGQSSHNSFLSQGLSPNASLPKNRSITHSAHPPGTNAESDHPPRQASSIPTLSTQPSFTLSTTLSVAPDPIPLEDTLSVLTNSIVDMYEAQIEPLPNPKSAAAAEDSLFGDDDCDQPKPIPFLAPTAANTLRNTWHGNNAGYDITFLNNLGAFFISRAQYYQLFSVLLMQPLKQLLLDVSIYLEVLLGSRLRSSNSNQVPPFPLALGLAGPGDLALGAADENTAADQAELSGEANRTNLSSVCTPKFMKLSKIDKTITPTYYATTPSLPTQTTSPHLTGTASQGARDQQSQPDWASGAMIDEESTPSAQPSHQTAFLQTISAFLHREHTAVQNLLDFTIQMDTAFQGYVISVLSKAKIFDPAEEQQPPGISSGSGQPLSDQPITNGVVQPTTPPPSQLGMVLEHDERFTIFDYHSELLALLPTPTVEQTSKSDFSPYSIIPQSAVPMLPSHHLRRVYSQYAAQGPTQITSSPPHKLQQQSQRSQIYPGSDHSDILPWSYSLGDLDHLFLQFYNPPAAASILPNCKIKLPDTASQTSIPILTNNKSFESTTDLPPSLSSSLNASMVSSNGFPQPDHRLGNLPGPLSENLAASLPLEAVLSPSNHLSGGHNSFNHLGHLIEDPSMSMSLPTGTPIIPNQVDSDTTLFYPPLDLVTQRKFINTAVVSLRLSQPPNQSCVTCLRALARVYCDCCRLYDDKRGKAVTHCSLCSICRQGIPSLLTHCMKCDVCYNKRTLRSWFAEGKSGNVHMRNSMIASRCGRIYASLHLTYPNDFDFTLTKGVEDAELLQIIAERDQKIISKLEFWDYSWLPSTVIEKLFRNCPFTPPSSNGSSRFSFDMTDADREPDGDGDGGSTDESILFDPSTNARVLTNTSSAVSFAKHDLDGSNSDECDLNKVDITRRLNLVDNTYSFEFKQSMVLKYYPYLGQRKHENAFYSIIEAYQREQSVEKPGLQLPNQNQLTFPRIPLMFHKETHPIYNPILRIRAKYGDSAPKPNPAANSLSNALQLQFGPSGDVLDDGISGLPMLLPTTITSDIQQRFVDTDDNLTYPHICITSIMSTSCFICLQPLSQGNATISTLSCSHVLHSSCLKSFLQNNGTKCFCRKSISANPLYSNQIENYLRSDPHGLIPNTEATISCNDCEISFNVTQYHVNFNRCQNCTSFNTFIAQVGRRLSVAEDQSDQPMTLADLLLPSANPNNNGGGPVNDGNNI